MLKGRSSGLLLPIFSLPGDYGVGTLGDSARQFIDFLAAARQHTWQILPLVPPGSGDSPYMSASCFAGNPLLLDLDLLQTWQNCPDTATSGYEEYASWAWSSVWLLDQPEESLLWAQPEEIDPTATTTREEAAALTCSLLCKLNLLPDLV